MDAARFRRCSPVGSVGLRTTSVGWLGLVLGVAARCPFAILTKWLLLTRLETRTKESNIYASIWVQNSDAQ